MFHWAPALARTPVTRPVPWMMAAVMSHRPPAAAGDLDRLAVADGRAETRLDQLRQPVGQRDRVRPSCC